MATRPGVLSAILISTGYRAEMVVMVIMDSINYPMIARSLIADSIFDKLADGFAIADRCFDSSQKDDHTPVRSIKISTGCIKPPATVSPSEQ